MNKGKVGILILVTACVIGCTSLPNSETNNRKEANNRMELKKARQEYFFNKLKDPETNQIPANARLKELQFSKNMKQRLAIARTDAGSFTHGWKELGPSNVGGRTRALAVDMRNNDVVMAGGASGGVWKSTDRGLSWAPKLDVGSNLSIVSIAQEPNDQDVWLASMGEGTGGGSAGGKGNGNPYLGTGIYKSTDNGETWTLITYDEINADRFASSAAPIENIPGFLLGPFQLTSKLLIHDDNGASVIYLCSQYFGIWRSTDGAQSFDRFAKFLSGGEDPVYSDLVVDHEDVMTAWLGPTPSDNNGFFRSYDLGDSFFEITPPSYPTIGDFSRTLIAFAPSVPTNVYAFTYDGMSDHYLYHFELDSFDNDTGPIRISERTAALQDFTGVFGGEFTTQNGYDMTLAVHPADAQFVVLGYTNLVRTSDGFQTAIDDNSPFSWIGGYDNPDNIFGNTHHPDQHITFFDPIDTGVVWTGHDGGISRTADITADPLVWESLNNDYNVTQYYTVALGRAKNNVEIVGGTQDNGTPIFDISGFQTDLLPSLGDVSSGDGAFCFVGDTVNYTSAQEGAILVGKGPDINFYEGYFERADLNQLFIHPFAVDENLEGTLFYPDAQDGLIVRNRNFIQALEAADPSLVDNNWEDINLDQARTITALKVTAQSPAHRLYFGGMAGGDPYIAYLDSSFVKTGADVVYQQLPEVESGSYLVDIAVNPMDGDEIILVYSSYNITGLFHSTDGGATLTAIEGNLGTDDQASGQGFTGPSMRAAEIVFFEGEKKYVVATSIGLFATSTLSGNNTSWILETELLDNVVIEDLDSRLSDGTVLVGTHGRGIFLGEVLGANTAPLAEDETFGLDENVGVGTEVGTVAATDAEGDQLSFSITGGNDDLIFDIDSEGLISVIDNALLDFEVTTEIQLTIEISDNELVTEIVVTVAIQDVNEVPEMEDQSFDIEENSEAGTEVGTVAASDPENDVLTYSIESGNMGGAFIIDPSAGSITVSNTEVLDFEQVESFTLLIKAEDEELAAFADVTVNLLDLDDALGLGEQIAHFYPNPARDVLFLNFPENVPFPQTVSVIDLSGKILATKKIGQYRERWTLPEITAGLYHLKVSYPLGNEFKKLIIGR